MYASSKGHSMLYHRRYGATKAAHLCEVLHRCVVVDERRQFTIANGFGSLRG
jgi:hypothetical protein